ncbi:MAG: hypothetical protein DRJ42_05670 [Deltaproteobacteria bacterium]|nr:MAG: hypothetical protein DRJ42_05670 [Deltaproteobacteria bacterium]
MVSLRQSLVRALADLESLGTPHAVVGGLAVSAHVEPRMTRDVDFAVGVDDDDEAEQVLFQMQQKGYTVRTVVEQSAIGRLATARLTLDTDDGILVDLLFSSSGIEKEIAAAAQRIELLSGVTARVAGVAHLIAMKLLSDSPGRPQDAIDLVALGRSATAADLAGALAAVRLITDRRCHRGRRLEEALDSLVARIGPTSAG